MGTLSFAVTTTLQIGDTLEGKYIIQRQIGEGGMGVVYAGQHRDLEMRVAIKVLHPFEADDPTMKDRFKAEARSSASIKHPNVVEVYDFGITPDGRPFFVMEYLEGESLADLLDRRKILRQSRVIEILDQVLSGLARAHKKNIIHRDLKPENIYLSKNEDRQQVVKILDFGIAKIMNEGNATITTGEYVQNKRSKATTRIKTEMGVVMGTPGYMAPEALTGRGRVDTRVDLFAVGILLFEMLTGRQPFRGKTAHEIMINTATKPVPNIRTINPYITKEMEQLCLIALAKNPDHRFQDAAEFIEYLTAAAVGKIPEYGRKCRTDVGIPSNIPKVTEELKHPDTPTFAQTSSSSALDLDLRDIDDFGRYNQAKSAASNNFSGASHATEPSFNGASLDVSPLAPRWQANGQTTNHGNGYIGPARAKRNRFSWSYMKLIMFLAVVGTAAYLIWTSTLFTKQAARNPGYKVNSSLPQQALSPEQTTPRKVTIWVDIEPADASVMWNGKVVTERPIQVSYGTKPVKVEVIKKGYRRRILVVIPDGEKSIKATLRKE